VPETADVSLSGVFAGPFLKYEMRGSQTDELARSDDLGLFPELREMPLIASDEVIRVGGVGAFEKWQWFLMSCSNRNRSPRRIWRCGRESTPAYSSKIGRET
jgi:hypothetical protein